MNSTTLTFEQVALCKHEQQLLAWMNRQVPQLCKSLPPSLQADAMWFFQATYAGHNMANLLRFFGKFYPPAWTLVHWLCAHEGGLMPHAQRAAQGQAMAMLLHMLDDHLVDGQVAPSYLTLQLRTQAWRTMQDVVCDVAVSAEARGRAEDVIDRYLGGVSRGPGAATDLETRCGHEALLGMVVPAALVADERVALGLERAFVQFGLSWRLLDDVQDLERDAREGSTNTVRDLYGVKLESAQGRELASRGRRELLERVAEDVRQRLLRAQQEANEAGFPGYGTQLRQLGPVVN